MGWDVVGNAMGVEDNEKAVAVKAKAKETTVGLLKVVMTSGGIERNNED